MSSGTDPDTKIYIRNKSIRSHPSREEIAVEIAAKISGVNKSYDRSSSSHQTYENISQL